MEDIKNFTLYELEFSQTAFNNHIENKPTVENEKNLIALIVNILDPARQAFGKPISVSSGFRNTRVNRFVGGERTSQHKAGEAADIYSSLGLEANAQIGRIIARQGKFDQLIFENVGKGNLTPHWIHVSYKRNGRNRGEIMKKVIGTDQYISLTKKDLNL